MAIDPAPVFTPHLSTSLAPYRDRLLGGELAAALHEWELANVDTGPLSERTLRESSVLPDPAVLRAYWWNLFDPEWSAATIGPWWDALAEMRTPVLLLLPMEPSPEDQSMIDRMPLATVEVWEGDGHWLHLVDPGRFAQRLRAWISASGGD